MNDPVPDEFLSRLAKHMDPAYRRIAEELIARRADDASECHWTDDCGSWVTTCRNYFQLNEGTPKDNGMNFCLFCGKTLKEFPEGGDDV